MKKVSEKGEKLGGTDLLQWLYSVCIACLAHARLRPLSSDRVATQHRLLQNRSSFNGFSQVSYFLSFFT